jgi:hypothetical protein
MEKKALILSVSLCLLAMFSAVSAMLKKTDHTELGVIPGLKLSGKHPAAKRIY